MVTFAAMFFSPAYVSYEVGSSSLCDKGSQRGIRGRHTRTLGDIAPQNLSAPGLTFGAQEWRTWNLESHVASWWDETLSEWQTGLSTWVWANSSIRQLWRSCHPGKTYLLEITLSHKTQVSCVCWSFFIYCLLASKGTIILCLIM